jgi:catechol 2,3-dioxygenase-like lactoylglutathione lyase family enzyme
MTLRSLLRLLNNAAILAICFSGMTFAAAQTRPAITGISHMCVYASDPAASDRFYTHLLGAAKGPDPQSPNGTRYYLSASQFVEVLPLPADHTISRMNCVAFTTSNASALRDYLQSRGVAEVGSHLKTHTGGDRWFTVHDPEGNLVEFIQPGDVALAVVGRPIGTRIIHVGFLVHSKSAEDAFYRGLLGFRPYWYGAMQPGKVDWISLQVPDGHDWLEYMMVGDGSTSPLDSINAQHLGVLNHFSIGVPNMEAAVTTLYAEGRLSPRHDGPQMGRDGKWQANLYDPDGTRVELMEFQPVMAPCCSAFTAESPTK